MPRQNEGLGERIINDAIENTENAHTLRQNIAQLMERFTDDGENYLTVSRLNC